MKAVVYFLSLLVALYMDVHIMPEKLFSFSRRMERESYDFTIHIFYIKYTDAVHFCVVSLPCRAAIIFILLFLVTFLNISQLWAYS
jgi:hypothetical protein